MPENQAGARSGQITLNLPPSLLQRIGEIAAELRGTYRGLAITDSDATQMLLWAGLQHFGKSENGAYGVEGYSAGSDWRRDAAGVETTYTWPPMLIDLIWECAGHIAVRYVRLGTGVGDSDAARVLLGIGVWCYETGQIELRPPRPAWLERILGILASVAGKIREIGARLADMRRGISRRQIEAAIQAAGSSGLNLQGRHMPGINLSQLELAHSNLSAADLSGADLSWADLTAANLAEAQLTRANLTGTCLNESNLRSADLAGADLSRAKLRQADLSQAIVTGANLVDADFNFAKLSGASLAGADLRGVHITLVDLNGADLRRTNWAGSLLLKVDMVQANLEEADLSESSLGFCDFSASNLKRACLKGSKLRAAQLPGADLEGADLSATDLRGANFDKANLSGVTMARSRYSQNTTWPEGFTPPPEAVGMK